MAFADYLKDNELLDYIKEHATDEGETYTKKVEEISGSIDSLIEGEPGVFRWGNANPQQIIDKETKWLKDEQTESCNHADGSYSYKHSYQDLHEDPEIEISNCEVHFKYDPVDKGKKTGECKICIPTENCDCLWIIADLLEYQFPTHKITVSDQIMHSRYLATTDVESAITELQQHLTSEAPSSNIPETINVSYAAMGLEAPSELSIEVELQNDPDRAWLQSGPGERAYTRHFGEREIIEDDEWFIPHEHQEEPDYADDLIDFPLSFWLPISEEINSTFYQKHLTEPEHCLRNNIATKKSPEDLKEINPKFIAQAAGGSAKDLDSWECLNNVGELAPYTAHNRRYHNSDGFFQGIVKGLQVYHKKVSPSKRKTFMVDKYRFHFLPSYAEPALINEKFKADLQSEIGQYQCSY
ncbi:MAG: hypothetical protein KDD53_11860, partial [Bdellovibrionales bacterium]|nr:hypothetical protein [Bdellovibrionales bacterium]